MFGEISQFVWKSSRTTNDWYGRFDCVNLKVWTSALVLGQKFGFEIGGSSETFLDAFLQSRLDILKLSNTQILAQATCVSACNDIQ